MDLPRPVYKDACGLGIIHKRGVPAPHVKLTTQDPRTGRKLCVSA